MVMMDPSVIEPSDSKNFHKNRKDHRRRQKLDKSKQNFDFLHEDPIEGIDSSGDIFSMLRLHHDTNPNTGLLQNFDQDQDDDHLINRKSLSSQTSSQSHSLNDPFGASFTTLLGDQQQNDGENQEKAIEISPDDIQSRQDFENSLILQQQRQRHGHRHKAPAMSVRCSCNLASCVHTNYMCKSEKRIDETGKELDAGCFVEELDPSVLQSSSSSSSSSGSLAKNSQSQNVNQRGVFEWNGRVATAKRGCVEMLPKEKQETCSYDETGAPVHCCTQDMCNYPKSFYPSNNLHSNANINGRLPSFDSGGFRRISSTGSTMANLNLDQQVWLRAALIAVPICGLTILLVLILVARRLLKSDDEYKNGDCRSNSRMKSNSPQGYISPNQSGLQPVLQFYPSPVPQLNTSNSSSGHNEYLLPKHCNCHNPMISPIPTHSPSSQTPSSDYSNSNSNTSNSNGRNPLADDQANSSETEELVTQPLTQGSGQGTGNGPRCHNCHHPSSTFNSFSDFSENESQHSFFTPQLPPSVLMGDFTNYNRSSSPKGKLNSLLSKFGIGKDKDRRSVNV